MKTFRFVTYAHWSLELNDVNNVFSWSLLLFEISCHCENSGDSENLFGKTSSIIFIDNQLFNWLQQKRFHDCVCCGILFTDFIIFSFTPVRPRRKHWFVASPTDVKRHNIRTAYYLRPDAFEYFAIRFD